MSVVNNWLAINPYMSSTHYSAQIWRASPLHHFSWKWIWWKQLTSVLRVLGEPEGLALVKAKGWPHSLATSRTNPWSGTRIPTSVVPGFRWGLRASVLSNTTVTGPGRSSRSNPEDIFTRPHLQEHNIFKYIIIKKDVEAKRRPFENLFNIFIFWEKYSVASLRWASYDA